MCGCTSLVLLLLLLLFVMFVWQTIALLVVVRRCCFLCGRCCCCLRQAIDLGVAAQQAEHIAGRGQGSRGAWLSLGIAAAAGCRLGAAIVGIAATSWLGYGKIREKGMQN